jgi:hypothetical protein
MDFFTVEEHSSDPNADSEEFAMDAGCTPTE